MSARKSRFGNLFTSNDRPDTRTPEPPDARQKAQPRKRQQAKTPSPVSLAVERTTGRRSDPAYTRLSVYIPITLSQDIKTALIVERKDASELVEELLLKWLSDRAAG
jgi:hypothetical protein